MTTSTDRGWSCREVLPIAALFGLLYFIQGIIEPTAGLITQPLQTQWTAWNLTQSRVSGLLLLIAIPWSLKPLFGLLSDFVPIFGSHRRAYLIAAAALTAASFLGLYLSPLTFAYLHPTLTLLLFAVVGVAFADVVVDALSVDIGQPRGITGQLQSIQWGASSLAMIVLGTLGGYIADQQRLDHGFAVCLGLSVVALIAVVLLVREPRRERPVGGSVRTALVELSRAARSPLVIVVGGFLFLWNFNPCSSNVLQNYMTEELKLSQQFVGHTLSIQAGGQVAACVVYGLICRRVPLLWLVHGSIVAGILATIAYLGMYDQSSAAVVSIAVGFAYMTANLIQLDLAARICPPKSAGTVFALLMAISNTGLSLSLGVSGPLYDGLAAYTGSRHLAFDLLVAIGAVSTSFCWLVVPSLKSRLLVE